MLTKWRRNGVLCLALLAPACAPKQPAAPAPAAPPAIQNVFVLLAEPDGVSSRVVITNQAGSQDLTAPYQAVRVARNDVAPTAPFTLDPSEVKRIFGPAIDALPSPEVVFLLYFDIGSGTLNAESLAMIPAILDAIRERHSTAITVTGHTDNTPVPGGNKALGQARADSVVTILKSRGVKDSDMAASSHAETEPLEKTPPDTPSALNRRVEVIVR